MIAALTVLSVLFILSVIVAVLISIRLRRITRLYAQLKINQPRIEEFMKVLIDLDELGGGMMEIRRVNPNNVFLLSSK